MLGAVFEEGIEGFREHLEQGLLRLDLAPEELEGAVQMLAGFRRAEAEIGGVEFLGVEAEAGEGAKAAGRLRLQDGGAARNVR